MSPSERGTLDDLAPARYLRTVDPIAGPVTPGDHALEHAYGHALLHAYAARQQLSLLHNELAQAGLTAILLKGAAHLLWLYDGPLPRALSDIDLLVRSSDLHAIGAVLGRMGFVAEPANSPEDSWLMAEEGPGLRFLRQSLLPIDLQTQLPGVRRSGLALGEARERLISLADEFSAHEGGLKRLYPMHEMIVAASHLGVHLLPPLTVSPKWLTDMLLLVAANRGASPRLLPRAGGSAVCTTDLIWPFATPEASASGEALWSWDEFWETADRWGVKPAAQRACASLNAYWSAGVPGVRPEERPTPIELLAGELGETHATLAAASVPAAYAERLSRIRSLSGLGPRVRFLAGLVVPSGANLRQRYHLADGAWLLPYYFLHPARTAWKVARGIAALGLLRLRRGRRVR